LGILGFPLGSPETKCHLDAGPMASHRVYYKGEGGGFPQVQVVVSLVNPNLSVVRPSLRLMTKARVHNCAGQERRPGVWDSVRMNIHTPK
jgi:hypothetical protein